MVVRETKYRSSSQQYLDAPPSTCSLPSHHQQTLSQQHLDTPLSSTDNPSAGKGGGVGLYIKCGLNFKLRDDVHTNIDNNEGESDFLCVEILLDSTMKNIILLVIYKHSSSASLDLYNLLISNNFYQLLTIPTRISCDKSSLLDLLITNYPDKIKCCSTAYNDLSDYLMKFFQYNYQTTASEKFNPINFKISYSTSRINKLNGYLSMTDWTDLFNCDDPNRGFELFFNIYNQAFESCCHIVSKKKLATLNKQQPWMTAALKN
ncbi:hypothetical protein HELRODRAFT_164334 [Helobdella robusta]|uniref:Uncharacterized protein n=1 Tax=Helobdella robusta TaxID=6412 RepID=T1EV99_HELRO|nr:hypothetical protein HELRODRAFT_164334 [Helobdella robusta]ESN94481.1 hypothetical protein HELRODRAFT_164334 [Helobdella robusta]